VSGWSEYILVFLAFVGAHVIPARPGIRVRLTALAGEGGYLWGYSLVSLGLLYWLVVAAGRAPFVPLWDYRPWQLWVPNLAMPVVVLLAVGGVGIANPFSFGGRANATFDPVRPGIIAVSRHPLLLAITLWAAAHVVPNGDLAHVLLFGLFALLGGLGMIMLDRRRKRQWGRARFQELARSTSLLPAGAWLWGRVRPGRDALPPRRLVIAALAYLALLALHPTLFGVSPLPQLP
jgi:uncharacterized membrane protein